ncbi:MAG: ParB/RepB/Spo0J family partition protein [Desulforegulaceae bacterium]|nr:ParB/RepB/Spo0J family partition protein [Desulforegulaceae bacterium]
MEKKKKLEKRRGLGKGLGALLPDIEPEIEKEEDEKEFVKISINHLKQNPYQPRKKFSEEEIEELSQSIKEYGILQPVLVRQSHDNNDEFYIIAGERRVRAAKLAELEKIPVLIKEITDEQMLQISIIENIQRENLNPVEEAKAFKRLISEFNRTQEELANIVGKSRPAISNTLRLLKLPENILDSLSDSLISGGHARALLGAKDEFIQNKVFYEILDKKLSVRETEHLVKRLNENDINLRPKPALPPEYKTMAVKLSHLIGTKVNISAKKNNTGKIEINFRDENELNKIFKLLNSVENENQQAG